MPIDPQVSAAYARRLGIAQRSTDYEEIARIPTFSHRRADHPQGEAGELRTGLCRATWRSSDTMRSLLEDSQGC